jgi:hypothetical protein
MPRRTFNFKNITVKNKVVYYFTIKVTLIIKPVIESDKNIF